MKLALVIENFRPAAGGNERSTQQIARQLIARGHEVTVLTNRADLTDDPLPGGRVVTAGGAGTSSASGLKRFARWAIRQLDEGDYDASLSVTTAVPATLVQPRGGTYRETLARNLATRPPGLKRALKQLAIYSSPKKLALLRAERLTLNSPRVKKVVAISRYVADQLFHHYTMAARRVEVIPNAAEVNRRSEDAEELLRYETRQLIGLEEEDVVFLFAAMNPGLKGLGPLIDAFSKTHAADDRARLIVAGTLDHRYQAQARRLGVSDAIRFVGPTRDTDPLYTACDVTVLPTFYDPSSKVVLESLLHGRPAISTLFNGASQWIHSPTGELPPPSPFDPDAADALDHPGPRAGRVIADPSDVDALAAAMIELCDDDERARCAAATEGLADHITMDAHVDRLMELFERVAPQKEASDSSG
ncbi:MAG: glycosyltransferase family 4 protein [Planctomycetota bacterium]|jgi:UDP-glucose:(heptosyl)LPS alpha-1,3-glucosyltransferase